MPHIWDLHSKRVDAHMVIVAREVVKRENEGRYTIREIIELLSKHFERTPEEMGLTEEKVRRILEAYDRARKRDC